MEEEILTDKKINRKDTRRKSTIHDLRDGNNNKRKYF